LKPFCILIRLYSKTVRRLSGMMENKQ